MKNWEMGRAGTLMPTAAGPLNGCEGQAGQDYSHMIKINDTNGQWNTDRNGHVPFMGY